MKNKIEDLISRVKFSVKSKFELRIGVRNKGKPGNWKQTEISVLNNQ